KASSIKPDFSRAPQPRLPLSRLLRLRASERDRLPPPNAKRAQNSADHVWHVGGRQSRLACRAHGLDNDAEDQVKANFGGKRGQTSFALGKPQICFQALPRRARDRGKSACAASDQHS